MWFSCTNTTFFVESTIGLTVRENSENDFYYGMGLAYDEEWFGNYLRCPFVCFF